MAFKLAEIVHGAVRTRPAIPGVILLCAVFRYVLFPTRLPELASLCVERLHVTINVVHACFCRGGHARVRTILFVHVRDRSAHHTFCARTCANKIRCAHRGLVYV